MSSICSKSQVTSVNETFAQYAENSTIIKCDRAPGFTESSSQALTVPKPKTKKKNYKSCNVRNKENKDIGQEPKKHELKKQEPPV